MNEGSPVPLRDHLESMMQERDVRYQQRFEATEQRLTAMNEFRGTVSDVIGKCITRSEALAMVIAACTITGTIVAVISFFMKR